MSTLLGKRKEREADEPAAKHHGSTLFVSNLPYTATSIDLNTLFSDIAPVRSAFVVLDQASGVSKGVGYVSFAIREDAQLAYEQINQDGLILDSRNLRVQWAESKLVTTQYKEKTQKEPMAKSEPMPKPPRPAQTNAPRDPLAIRTVAISGLPSSVDSKQLWKKIRKLDGAEKVDWPITSANGDEDRSTAHALFTTPAAAADAVNKLHAHVFKGSLLSATLKKRLDGLAKAPKTAKAANPKGPAPNRASRLIVRNLPFNISEQDLRALFLPYGPIHSVDIPSAVDDAKEEDGEATLQAKRGKGFAFVWMLSRKDAERAMEECNGMKVQAGMAARLVADKQKRKKQRREEAKAEKATTQRGEDEGGEEDESENEEEDGDAGAKPQANERVIAVDWALSKDNEDELDESAPTLSEETPVKEESSKTPGRKGKGGRATGVKQTKIVRQADRVDPVTGKGRSKGYGFLEMIKHADALRVLRWANNNTEAGRLFEEWWKAEVEDLIKIEKKKPTKDDARIKRLKEELERGAPVKSRGTLIVEFSIENVQVVQRRTAQQREKQQGVGEKKVTRKVSLPDIKSEPAEERSPKKRRMSAPKLLKQSLQKQSSKDAAPKSGHKVGSLIGRKRKERKSKKGAS
ncbi:predicted protein [Postia placenta Mad-698-R]|nr:predicted protein [Postia placenta Mad-698-R]